VSAKHIFSAPASSHYSATVTASWSRTLLYLVVEHQTHVNDRTAVPAPGRLSTYQLWHFSGKIGVLLGFSQKPPDPVLQNFELFLYCFIIGQGPHDHIAIAEECSINLDDMRLHITWIKFALILFVTHSQFSTRHIKMPPYDPDFQTELQPTNNIQAEWRKMSEAKRPNAPSTPDEPPPPPSNWQLTTHSQGLTHNASDQRTHPKHSHALAALPSAPHNISHENARCSIKHGLTTLSTLMGAPLLTPPFTTPTHTNSCPF
jgi:hypothetical protein